MIKSVILSVILFFLANIVSSQHILFDWQNCLRGKYYTNGAAACITENGYLIATMQMRKSNSDIVLIKTSLTGDSLWTKYYGGSDGEWPCGIFPSLDGNCYLVGTECSDDGDITNNPYPNSCNLWIIKIDSSGNKLWDKIYGGSNFDEAINAVVTHDGGLAILSDTYSYNGDITNFYGAMDIWVLKLDNNGNKQWDYTIGTPGFDYATNITQMQDSGFIISGGFKEGSQGNIQCYNADSNYLDGFLYRLDKHGTFVAKKCYPGMYHDDMQQVIELTDGYLISAITSSPDISPENIGFHTGYNHFGDQTTDIWLQKTDFEWNIEWERCYGGSGWEDMYRIYQCSNGDYMMFGTTESNNGDVTGWHNADPILDNSVDIWMVRINNSGLILWQRCIGTYGNQWIFHNTVLKIGEADYVIACITEASGYDDVGCEPMLEPLKQFIWLSQITDTAASVGITEQLSTINIKLYPNPATDYIALEIPPEFDMKHTIAEITDIAGRKMQNVVLTCHKPYFYTGDLPAGLYLLRLINKQGFVSKRFVKN